MKTTIEIVRFRVPPEREAELVGGHAEARRAIQAVSPPGAVWSRLARLEPGGWIEIVAWGSREVFERALDRSPHDPVARAWFDLAEPGWTILLGEAEGAPPPREGALELAPNGGDVAGGGWSLRVELDARAWVDPGGWTEREPAVLTITAAGGGPSAPARERAVIAHAVDVEREEGG